MAKKRGRPCLYLTLEEFKDFRNHDHKKLKYRVGYIFWGFNVMLALMGILVALLGIYLMT